MSKENETVDVFMTIVIAAISCYLYAVGFMYNWNWFVHPLGASEIGIIHGMGIHIVCSYFLVGLQKTKEPNDMPGIIGRYILSPLMLLGIGVILHYLMQTT